ncbi:MAG: hypothetical protein SCK57_03185 [Bacillota bacterium]|nr:hypothetical protein [Bacillota bacterium]MDW7676643.1 hypothetical protein [Bacillota bacterium]
MMNNKNFQKSICLLLMIILVGIFVMAGCQISPEAEFKGYSIGRHETDQEIQEVSLLPWAIDFFPFVMDEYYQMPELITFDLYQIIDELFVDYYFPEDVTRESVMKSKRMASELFVIGMASYMFLSMPPELEDLRQELEQINHRVFIADKLVVEQTTYLHQGMVAGGQYLENTQPRLAAREEKTDVVSTFQDAVASQLSLSIGSIHIQKSFKGYVVFVQIDTRSKMETDEKQWVKQEIEHLLAPALAAYSEELYGRNQDSLGIVLELYQGGKRYHQETYHNSDEKYWFDEDWRNYDFFGENFNVLQAMVA